MPINMRSSSIRMNRSSHQPSSFDPRAAPPRPLRAPHETAFPLKPPSRPSTHAAVPPRPPRPPRETAVPLRPHPPTNAAVRRTLQIPHRAAETQNHATETSTRHLLLPSHTCAGVTTCVGSRARAPVRSPRSMGGQSFRCPGHSRSRNVHRTVFGGLRPGGAPPNVGEGWAQRDRLVRTGHPPRIAPFRPRVGKTTADTRPNREDQIPRTSEWNRRRSPS